MDWVVIVDDDAENLMRTGAILSREGMKVTKLSSGNQLLDYIEGMSPLPDLILLDILMPRLSGFETLKALREKLQGSYEIPVIFLTGSDDMEEEKEGLTIGAVDFIRKPYYPEILILRVKRTIELARLRKDLSAQVEKKTRENNRLTLHVVQTLAQAIDAKDTYTNGHSGRVAAYSREIATRLGYDDASLDEIYMMGLLHDVGKIGVPDAIINKPDRLTDEEFEEIKKHPAVGDRILKNIKEMPKLAYGARWHHERMDGRGYPDGLSGAAIPEEARIIAVADSYDAMTSNRSYRKALPQNVVREELIKGRGTQFDERIADVMIRILDEDVNYTMREGAAEDAGLLQTIEEDTVRHIDGMSGLPALLSELSQLDTELGLYLCGDEEDYLDALSIFAQSVPIKLQKLNDALAKEDLPGYKTLVHSLKSSSRTIGATVLSEMARRLEKAADEGDLGIVQKRAPEFSEAYKELGNLLAPLSDPEALRFVTEMDQAGSKDKRKVFLVDDDPMFLTLFGHWLSEEYRVFEFEDGASALSRLHDTTPDLILLDYEMPGMDGCDFMQRLRERYPDRDYPVIFITGKNDRGHVEHALEYKPEGYILKTSGKETVLSRIRMFFTKVLFEQSLTDEG